ncbi:MAG: hypothetical protein E7487_10600 [Ruminococcaceae bacterium]|nr:hypothetical protein [Oscillospiraceae bacterium]
MKNIIRKWYAALAFPQEWDEAFEELLNRYELTPCMVEDYDDNVDMQRNLLMYLYFCERTEALYEEMSISKDILLDTLKDIVVWTKIYWSMHSTLGLAETRWLCGHLKRELFKLGRLQFILKDGYAEIHIPRGGPLLPEECRKSLDLAQNFYRTYFPEKPFDRFTCHSWLLDDTLKQFLGANSNIVKFMEMFEIKERGGAADDAIQYTFRWDARRATISNFEAKNSFAVKLKEYVLNGGALYTPLGEIAVTEIEK